MKLASIRRFAVPAAALILGVWPCTAASQAQASDRWYVASIGGTPVGYMEEATSPASGGIETRTRLRLVLNRMGSRVEMSTEGSTRENPAGELLFSETKMMLSAQATKTRAEVGDRAVRLTSEAGGRQYSREIPFKGTLTGPDAVRRLTAAKLSEVGDRIDYQIFSPELSEVTRVSRVLTGVEEVTVEGGKVSARKIEEKMEAYPVPTTLWVNAEGYPLRTAQPGPFGEVSTVLSSESAAKLAAGGAQLPEEIYASTLMRTQIRIPDARKLSRLEIRLRQKDPALGWPDLSGQDQKVLSETKDSLTLVVTRPAPAPGHEFPVPVTDAIRPYLTANAFVQSDDPELRAKAKEIVGGETDVYLAGLKLERWVAQNMKFDMGVVLAPSTEVYKNRRGTCTEYAMLLTTLARSLGIPSRFVMGYVYLDGIFGGHAWTEILAGDRWIPLDAAVITKGPADAGRFAFIRSSLDDGVSRLTSGAAAQLYGHIDVEVLAYTLDGEAERRIPRGSVPYKVTGDRYLNTGLGVELVRPEGFRFVDLDSVWPDRTLVGIDGPSDAEVRLETRPVRYWQDPEKEAVAGLKDLVPSGRITKARLGANAGILSLDGDRAAFAVPAFEKTWFLTASGPGAEKLLREVATGLKLPG